MAPSLGRKALDNLGERCASGVASPSDIEQLARFTDEHLAALESADASLREGLGLKSGAQADGALVSVSNRLKRDRRILEKLERSTKLSRLQDIVGFRVVGDFRLSQQTRLADRIEAHFAGKKVDRRSEPSYGYRAVHVVIEVDRFWVEIQIRTFLQDYWANGMEALSRRWGRQIQYGEPPTYENTMALVRRTQALLAYRELAESIARVESRMDGLMTGALTAVDALTPAQRIALRHSQAGRRGAVTFATKRFKTQVDNFLRLAADV